MKSNIIRSLLIVFITIFILTIQCNVFGDNGLQDDFIPGAVLVRTVNATPLNFFIDEFTELNIETIEDLNEGLRNNFPDLSLEELDRVVPLGISFRLTLYEKTKQSVLSAVEILNVHPQVELARPEYLLAPNPSTYSFTIYYRTVTDDIIPGLDDVVVKVESLGQQSINPDLIPQVYTVNNVFNLVPNQDMTINVNENNNATITILYEVTRGDDADDREFVPGEVLVRMINNTPFVFFNETFPELNIEKVVDLNEGLRKNFPNLPLEELDRVAPLGISFRLTLYDKSKQSVLTAIEIFNLHPKIELARPEYLLEPNPAVYSYAIYYRTITNEHIPGLNDVLVKVESLGLQNVNPDKIPPIHTVNNDVYTLVANQDTTVNVNNNNTASITILYVMTREGDVDDRELVPGVVLVRTTSNTPSVFFNDTFPDLNIEKVIDLNEALRKNFPNLPLEELDRVAPLGISFRLTLYDKSRQSVLNAVELLNLHPQIELARPEYLLEPNPAVYSYAIYYRTVADERIPGLNDTLVKVETLGIQSVSLNMIPQKHTVNNDVYTLVPNQETTVNVTENNDATITILYTMTHEDDVAIDDREFIPGEIIVGTINATNIEFFINTYPELNIEKVVDLNKGLRQNFPDKPLDILDRVCPIGKYFQIYLNNKTNEQTIEAVKVISRHINVAYARPNYLAFPCAVPNDPRFSNLWGITKIQAPQAWDISIGSSTVAVGVLDSGIDHNHPDLAGNIDLSLAYYVVNNSPSDTMDYLGHGTSVAGIIGAIGNNSTGVVGVNWNIKMIPIKIVSSNNSFIGLSTTTLEALAIQYATLHNIKIINLSFQIANDPDLINAVQNYQGLLIISADNNNLNNDLSAAYVSFNALGNVIFVASSNTNDQKDTFSNYGVNTVALAAPGSNIDSTILNSSYDYCTGTSMAAPYVTGTAALLLSYNYNLTTQQLKSAILNNVDKVPALNGLVSTGGRLNTFKALQSISTPYKTFDGGGFHTLYLKTDGTVWATGMNADGQLGNGSTTGSVTPLKITSISDVKEVSAGMYHSMALKRDGTVWAWGDNLYGQLGDGTFTDRKSPIQVPGLSNIISIIASQHHSVALKNDGTVWVWGANTYGQLGIGIISNYSSSPTQIPGMTSVKKISGFGNCTFIIKTDGTLWATGENVYGILGDGTTTTRVSPVKITAISNVIDIASNSGHTVALKSDGTVWTWGSNSNGQLGNGTTTNSLVPVQVTSISSIVSIAAGSNHCIALKNNGIVYTWGYNMYGNLGDGTTTGKTAPVQVTSINNISAVTSGYNFCVAKQSNGACWGWGENDLGQFGIGNNTMKITLPTAVLI